MSDLLDNMYIDPSRSIGKIHGDVLNKLHNDLRDPYGLLLWDTLSNADPDFRDAWINTRYKWQHGADEARSVLGYRGIDAKIRMRLMDVEIAKSTPATPCQITVLIAYRQRTVAFDFLATVSALNFKAACLHAGSRYWIADAVENEIERLREKRIQVERPPMVGVPNSA